MANILRVALVTAALGAVAHAAGGITLAVSVGKSVERDVGNANGYFCDDPSLIEASLVTRGERNVWIVTGKQPGTTQCRVGTDQSRASFVFDVTVTARTASPSQQERAERVHTVSDARTSR